MSRPTSRTPSSSSAPPETTFFVDRDLGKRFAAILGGAGLSVEWHDDHFPQKTPDEVWLREVTRRGWVVLTHDKKMRYTSRIRDEILGSGARVFIIRSARLTASQLAQVVVNSRTRVTRFLARHPAPFIAKVLRDPHDLDAPGRVELWLALE